jgi:hypothetical protein
MYTCFWWGNLNGRHACKLEDNIKMDLKEIGVNWVNLAVGGDKWRAVIYTIMSLGVA